MFRIISENNELSLMTVVPEPRSGFRCFEINKNSLYELENEQYVHFFYLLRGELMVGGMSRMKPVVATGDFFFINKTKIHLLATKRTKFVLFSINKYHRKMDPLFDEFLTSILSDTRKRQLSLEDSNPLSAFFRELIMVWERKLNDPVIQDIKRKEFLILLHHLYSDHKKETNFHHWWPHDRLSLS